MMPMRQGFNLSFKLGGPSSARVVCFVHFVPIVYLNRAVGFVVETASLVW